MAAPEYDAIIVGAGFGGMGTAIELKRLGLDNLLILERESDVGGTWHVNHYPGLTVDIASATYSYSFEPNPHWSRVFAPGAELKRYAGHVADKYDLRRHMRFGAAVEGARWDEEDRKWVVQTNDGQTTTARFLVAATGYLSQPATPDIEGIDDFAGTVIHSAKWDNDFDPAGRRIGLIGTGATGVQLIPELARTAAELTVYQRTPIWVVPKIDFAIPAVGQSLFARIPLTQKVFRYANSALLEGLVVFGVLHYKRFSVFNKIAQGLSRAHLRLQVRDRATRKKLVPQYSFGCKRPTFSNTYFPAFNKPQVNLETESITRVTSDGVVTADGRRTPIDTLVLATGFNIWDVNFPAFEIIGRGGRDLGKWWRENRFQAYQGISVPSFPNFVAMAGPYSYSGLSYFDTVESQMRHVRRLLGELRRRDADTFEVTEDANARFLAEVDQRLGESVFYTGNCASSHSYYFNQHGEAALLRPTSTPGAYRAQSRFPLTDYNYA